MAARPAAARQELCANGRARRSRRARRRRARRWPPTGAAASPASIPPRRRDEDAARDIAPNCSPPICGERATTSTRSRRLPPGRFLMPGDLEGSPALTFAPLPLAEGAEIAPGSLAAMMERRYEAYKTHVVRPFFRDHFSRLDRQIVLVDALAALNSGPGRAARSRERAGRGAARLPRRPLVAARVDLPPAHRPHPVRRDQGRPSASHQPRPARGYPARADRQGDRARRRRRRRDRRHRARRDPRDARGARSATAARRSTRSSACRRRARRSAARCSTARPRRPCFPANCRTTRTRSSRATRSPCPKRRTTGASCASARRSSRAASRAPHIRLDRALQFLIGDRLA